MGEDNSDSLVDKPPGKGRSKKRQCNAADTSVLQELSSAEAIALLEINALKEAARSRAAQVRSLDVGPARRRRTKKRATPYELPAYEIKSTSIPAHHGLTSFAAVRKLHQHAEKCKASSCGALVYCDQYRAARAHAQNCKVVGGCSEYLMCKLVCTVSSHKCVKIDQNPIEPCQACSAETPVKLEVRTDRTQASLGTSQHYTPSLWPPLAANALPWNFGYPMVHLTPSSIYGQLYFPPSPVFSMASYQPLLAATSSSSPAASVSEGHPGIGNNVSTEDVKSTLKSERTSQENEKG